MSLSPLVYISKLRMHFVKPNWTVGLLATLTLVAMPMAKAAELLRALQAGDLRQWHAIEDAHLTPDGQWLVYVMAPLPTTYEIARSERSVVARNVRAGNERRYSLDA